MPYPFKNAALYGRFRIQRWLGKTWLKRDLALPINWDPPVRCWLHHAHLTGLLAAPPTQNFLCNYYINIHVFGDRLPPSLTARVGFFDFDPYIALDSLPGSAPIQAASWDPGWCAVSTSHAIAERAITALDEGKYLETYVNEFFLTDCAASLRHNFPHVTLIYGFLASRQSFLCASYRRDGKFGTTHMPAALLGPAISVSPIPSADGIGACPRGPQVREISRSQLQEFLPAPSLIAEQLTDFLSSKPSQRFRQETINGRYGMEACDYIRDSLAFAVKRRTRIKLTTTRLFWERARLMGLRLRRLSEAGMLARGNNLITAWKTIEERFRTFHIGSCAYNARLGGGNGTLPAIERWFHEVSQREVECLRQIGDAVT